MDELTETNNVLNASNTIKTIQTNQTLIPNDTTHSQNSSTTHSNHIDIEHSYKQESHHDQTNETKTVNVGGGTVGQTITVAVTTVKSVITTNNTSTIVSNTLQPNPVNSSTLPINLSVELRKIQQSAGLITSSSNSTFISKHIYHSADKMQTGSSLTARIPAPNVTVVDKNGENIRILKRVPDSNFGTHSYDNSAMKSNQSSSSAASSRSSTSINLISSNAGSAAAGPPQQQQQQQQPPPPTPPSSSSSSTTNSIYDQHIRVLTPVEIMRTLPSLHDHEMTSNESTATSNFSTALCKSRRNTITSSHENSKDTVDSTAIDSSNGGQKKIDTSSSGGGGGDEEMPETHINNIIVTSKMDEVASPVVSSTQLKPTENWNTFTNMSQSSSLTHSSSSCSSPSSTSNAVALTMVRGDKLIEHEMLHKFCAPQKKKKIQSQNLRNICFCFVLLKAREKNTVSIVSMNEFVTFVTQLWDSIFFVFDDFCLQFAVIGFSMRCFFFLFQIDFCFAFDVFSGCKFAANRAN